MLCVIRSWAWASQVRQSSATMSPMLLSWRRCSSLRFVISRIGVFSLPGCATVGRRQSLLSNSGRDPTPLLCSWTRTSVSLLPSSQGSVMFLGSLSPDLPAGVHSDCLLRLSVLWPSGPWRWLICGKLVLLPPADGPDQTQARRAWNLGRRWPRWDQWRPFAAYLAQMSSGIGAIAHG